MITVVAAIALATSVFADEYSTHSAWIVVVVDDILAGREYGVHIFFHAPSDEEVDVLRTGYQARLAMRVVEIEFEPPSELEMLLGTNLWIVSGLEKNLARAAGPINESQEERLFAILASERSPSGALFLRGVKNSALRATLVWTLKIDGPFSAATGQTMPGFEVET